MLRGDSGLLAESISRSSYSSVGIPMALPDRVDVSATIFLVSKREPASSLVRAMRSAPGGNKARADRLTSPCLIGLTSKMPMARDISRT